MRTIERVTLWLANGAAPLLLLATALLVYLENRWATPVFRAPEGAFLAGSVGTEFAPLPVVLAPPAFAAVFATPPDPAAVTRGAIVYQTHCVTCHGAPGAAAGTWQPGSRQGEVIPPEEIGTDRERVSIRHAEALATRLQGLFASGYVARYNFAHPFATVREYLRPGPGGGGARLHQCPDRGCLHARRTCTTRASRRSRPLSTWSRGPASSGVAPISTTRNAGASRPRRRMP
ncbi:MAG: cytochrome c, partial [SAR202 cluster bacterium]|nr:cytochrome c [SAR202 cluster bacterium]